MSRTHGAAGVSDRVPMLYAVVETRHAVVCFTVLKAGLCVVAATYEAMHETRNRHVGLAVQPIRSF